MSALVAPGCIGGDSTQLLDDKKIGLGLKNPLTIDVDMARPKDEPRRKSTDGFIFRCGQFDWFCATFAAALTDEIKPSLGKPRSGDLQDLLVDRAKECPSCVDVIRSKRVT